MEFNIKMVLNFHSPNSFRECSVKSYNLSRLPCRYFLQRTGRVRAIGNAAGEFADPAPNRGNAFPRSAPFQPADRSDPISATQQNDPGGETGRSRTTVRRFCLPVGFSFSRIFGRLLPPRKFVGLRRMVRRVLTSSEFIHNFIGYLFVIFVSPLPPSRNFILNLRSPSGPDIRKRRRIWTFKARTS